MTILDRFAYVKELHRTIGRYAAENRELKDDVKKLVDCIASTKAVLAPFQSRSIPEDWAVVRRQSVAREIGRASCRERVCQYV